MASCLRGAFPPVDLRAVCLVRAIVNVRLRARQVGVRFPTTWEEQYHIFLWPTAHTHSGGGVKKADLLIFSALLLT